MNIKTLKEIVDVRTLIVLSKIYNNSTLFTGTRMTPLTASDLHFISLAATNWVPLIERIENLEKINLQLQDHGNNMLDVVKAVKEMRLADAISLVNKLELQ